MRKLKRSYKASWRSPIRRRLESGLGHLVARRINSLLSW
jgi:hypothetical protein